MIAILDVQYEGSAATGGMVLIKNWTDKRPHARFHNPVENCAAYEPGQFCKRELPVLQNLLERTCEPVDIVVIDAYVDLDNDKPGLGRHLFDARGSTCAVVGVAKSRFKTTTHATEVCRGDSTRPLFVTAAGMPARQAAVLVRSRSGDHRVPDMMKMADGIARGNVTSE